MSAPWRGIWLAVLGARRWLMVDRSMDPRGAWNVAAIEEPLAELADPLEAEFRQLEEKVADECEYNALFGGDPEKAARVRAKYEAATPAFVDAYLDGFGRRRITVGAFTKAPPRWITY